MNWQLPVWALLLTTPIMVGMWLGYRWVHRNASLADVGFCVSFGLVAVGFALVTTGDVSHRVVVAALATVYAVRLASYLATTRICGVVEDQRYQGLREQWGERAGRYFLVFFLGQALAVAVFSIPLAVLMSNPDPAWQAWEILGLVIGVIGIVGEAVADGQLHRFRRAPGNRGKTCRQGLWRYSRHPNYFFEVVHWCAYVVMSLGLPDWWLTLVAPVVMIGVLLKVSGIPLAEARAVAVRGDDYREYQRTTNAFIPWFPGD